jgi:hypothetical protein
MGSLRQAALLGSAQLYPDSLWLPALERSRHKDSELVEPGLATGETRFR